MTSCRRPKECEASRYRHGCDPPTQPLSPSDHIIPQRPSPPPPQSRLPHLPPSLLTSVFRFHKEAPKLETSDLFKDRETSRATISSAALPFIDRLRKTSCCLSAILAKNCSIKLALLRAAPMARTIRQEIVGNASTETHHDVI